MKIRLPEQVRILIEFLFQEFQCNDKFFTIVHYRVCARQLLLISNHRKRKEWSYLRLQVRILKLIKI